MKKLLIVGLLAISVGLALTLSTSAGPKRTGGGPESFEVGLVDAGFEAFALAPSPVAGWYSDDVLRVGDPWAARLSMTIDNVEKVEGDSSLLIEQLRARPEGWGLASLSQVVRLAQARDAQRFDLSASMRGQVDGPVTLHIYVWGPDNAAEVIAERDVELAETWSDTTVSFEVPEGHDVFGIMFYLPPEDEARVWLDDVRLSSDAS